ncbi:hypothetical protein IFVP201_C1250413 [Vibrio parahaemolyticus]
MALSKNFSYDQKIVVWAKTITVMDKMGGSRAVKYVRNPSIY